MRTSEKGIVEIISHEAIVLSRYKDSVGVWTIGIGHTKAAGNIDPEDTDCELTLEECLGLFKEDLKKYEQDVNEAFKVELTQEQFDAAVSFHYNTGAIKRACWVKHFNRKEVIAAETNSISGIMAWSKPPEIIKRREKERDLFFKGIYSKTNKLVNVYRADQVGNVIWHSGKTFSLHGMFEETINISISEYQMLKNIEKNYKDIIGITKKVI